jgi:hypothetical protein
MKRLFLFMLLASSLFAVGIEIGVGAKYQAAESYHPKLIDADLSTTDTISTSRISLLMNTEITSISFFVSPQKGKMIIFDESNPQVKYELEFDGKSETARIPLPKVKMKNIIFGWVPDEYGNKLTLKEIIISSNNKEQLDVYDRIHRLLYKTQ